jgi:secreted protein with Ig-like and vWFA domain
VRASFRNLRPDDLFTLVVFDDSAQVVIPLQKPVNRQGMIAAIERITEGGSTNLIGNWLLGRAMSCSKPARNAITVPIRGQRPVRL